MSKKALFVGGCPAPWHRFEPAAPAITTALEEIGLEVTATGIYHPDGGDAFEGDYSALTRESLGNYNVLVLYTTGRDRFGADVSAIVDFAAQGKAVVGIHNATDSFTDDPAYVELMGARFRHHPEQLDVAVEIVDAAHPIMQGVVPFTVHDELYMFADYQPAGLHLLAQTRSADDNGPIPIAWTREPGAGRVFYISLGHNPEVLQDSNWRHFFQNGVRWALRDLG